MGSAVPWSLRRRQRLSGVFAVAFLAAAALLRWARLEEASEAGSERCGRSELSGGWAVVGWVVVW